MNRKHHMLRAVIAGERREGKNKQLEANIIDRSSSSSSSSLLRLRLLFSHPYSISRDV